MVELTRDNFKTEVVDSKKVVVVDFWAPWCMPCKMIAPHVDALAKDYKDSVKVGKINIDDNGELATDLSIMNIPTIIFFKNGREMSRLVGVNKKEHIESRIKELI